MNRKDVQQIVARLPWALAAIATAISGEIAREFATAIDVLRFRFPIHESRMTREAYGHFRTTDWLLNAFPDAHWGPGMQTAVLRKKDFVEPPPVFCFHATEAENYEGIVAMGLFPGNRVGKSPRCRTFCDSVHYIFAALTKQEAISWVQRLADRGDFCICTVRVEGFGLVPDPCSATVDGPPAGYILNIDHVPPSLVGEIALLQRT